MEVEFVSAEWEQQVVSFIPKTSGRLSLLFQPEKYNQNVLNHHPINSKMGSGVIRSETFTEGQTNWRTM